MADLSSAAGPGLERLDKYVITVFGPDGREIRPFKGSNMIQSGYLTDFNRDGILDILDPTNYGVDDALDVQVVEQQPEIVGERGAVIAAIRLARLAVTPQVRYQVPARLIKVRQQRHPTAGIAGVAVDQQDDGRVARPDVDIGE